MPNFFKFLGPIFSRGYLGVDIGTAAIKIAEVDQGREKPRMVNYGILESSSQLVRLNSALQTSSLKLFEKDAAELLKLILKKMKPRTSEAMASIPSFSAFVTTLDFPEMATNDLNKTMVYQAQRFIPSPLSEVAIDWLKVGGYRDEKGFQRQQILLVSVAQELIKKYQRIFRAAGLKLRFLEIESLSLGRALIGNDPAPAIVVDIGSRSTNVAVFENGQLKVSSQNDFGGGSLTQALTSSLNISPLRAEELKKEVGLGLKTENYELSTVLLTYLDVIIKETKKAEEIYLAQRAGAPKIERIVLSGGTANLKGIADYFQNQLGITTVKGSPFLRFEYPDILEPMINDLSSSLTIALGLTLHEF